MDLNETQKNWDKLAKSDPLYAVLSDPAKRGKGWDKAEFFATGQAEIEALCIEAAQRGLAFGNERALDFGCGVGRLSQALAAHFEAVVGIDIAPSMLDLARAYDRSQGRCRFVLNERPDLALFPDAHFDLVYSNIVLQHMAPELALGYIPEFIRVLKPGGFVVFQLPSATERSWWRGALKACLPKPVLESYRKFRYGKDFEAGVEIEMNGVSETKVLGSLRMAGARIVSHDNGWYWAQK